MTRRREGFSLIEALIALSIAAMTLTAIFELQTQMVRAQQRASQGLDEVAAQENALALTRDLNPMAQPEGSIRLPDGDTIRWESEPLTEPRINAGLPEGDGRFEVQLFTVTVTIERDAGRAPAPLVFDRVGWRQVALPDSF
ncbi:prepilin-type N-terminal cleavage/methylation domain-containing protein [Brevundimonas sp.]|uniref:type IV pilus modification PilV family protein n=1 Tax=Brevundimonas sp. TaxID=1871086 RepID=UPI00261A1225|nr:prepilin-type N-terminal cleavage/methylation domain-containing protein [Brevundimonas sp.]